jgi:hypothetical protein
MAAETRIRTLHWYDFLFINSNWFALTLRSQVLAGLIPLLFRGCRRGRYELPESLCYGPN